MKKIVLTGGGTAGHVTPNIALLPGLKDRNYEIRYIGSVSGMEKDLIEKEGIAYDGIASGKLRRYFDWKNFTDPFHVARGYFEARSILKKWQPDVVFSKGGFVAVPVVLAAQSLGIPNIVHESDMTPGLANKLCIKGATRVCCSFPDTMAYLPASKAVFTGLPIRSELLAGDREKGIAFSGCRGSEPILLVVGGSSGSVAVNNAIRSILPTLRKEFQVIHLCGKGNLDETLKNVPNYVQYEYIREELKDLLAAADIVVSRAGANAIYELLALHKPNLLIPLSAEASRGDQILNARSFEKQGFSQVLEEEKITDDTLLAKIRSVYEKRDQLAAAMEKSEVQDAVSRVLGIIDAAADRKLQTF